MSHGGARRRLATAANLRLAGVPIGMMQIDLALPARQFGARRAQSPRSGS